MNSHVWDMWWPGGVALGVLSALFAWVSVRTREPGSKHFALGLGTVCVIFLVKNWLLPDFGRTSPVGLPMAGFAALCMVLGMYRYMGYRAPVWRMASLIWLGWLALCVLLHRIQIAGPLTAHVCLTGLMLLPAAMAFWAARREPGVGFHAIGIAFLVHPLCVIVAVTTGWPELRMRLTTWVPFTIAGMTLLIVAQLRARARLAEELHRRIEVEQALNVANDNLEAKVEARTRDLREMISALEGFNRMVSHDLRGPLSGITGLAELCQLALAEGRVDSLPRLLELIRKQGDASVRLVAALLKLAKLSRCELEHAAVDLRQCAVDAIEQLRLSTQGVERVAWHVGEMPVVQADRTLLQQVFTNLLCNAAKFSADAPTPAVEIGAKRGADGLTVYVRDNGVGFDAANARLFEPFARLHGNAFEGTGIGLSIVRKVIECHGGRVWCESRPRHGATFFFTLGQQAA